MDSEALASTPRAGVSSEPYQYWILRYVPSVIRGEFMNIGVIVGNSSEWAIRAIPSTYRRARVVGDVAQCREWLEHLRAEVEATRELELPGHVRMSRTRIERLQTFHNNNVQIHEGGPLVAENADAGAQLMYSLLVAEDVHEPTRRRKTVMNEELEATLTRWRSARTGRSFHRNPRVKVGRSSQKFDFAVSSNWLALTHTWPFDGDDRGAATRTETNLRAWSMSVQRLRNDGGEVTVGKSRRTTRIASDVNIGVLVSPPKSPLLWDAYAEAQELWSDLDVNMFIESQQEELLTALTEAPA